MNKIEVAFYRNPALIRMPKPAKRRADLRKKAGGATPQRTAPKNFRTEATA